jgi:hypothetical protein
MSNRAVVYKTASNYEGKACRELAELGINAIAPWDESGDRAKITAPGYIFAAREVRHAFLKHVRGKPLGTASVADVARLYVLKPKRRAEEANPFKQGDVVSFPKLVLPDGSPMPVTVASTSGRLCVIEWDMLGKRQSQSIHYTQLRPG